ncbi:hypothetical protein [Streptomyces sp. NBC_01565]|nr:hypothetical protein [Streptomyces sp. NBC_01565]MCX4539134.1 hypothetical protein [Streptomyces sp. NBC_01565]
MTRSLPAHAVPWPSGHSGRSTRACSTPRTASPRTKLPSPRHRRHDRRPPARHILTYSGRLWIGPGEIDQIRCVDHASTTGQRCKQTVLNNEDPYPGAWEQTPIAVPPGRAAQESLWADRTMWVFSINGLDYHGY